MHKCIQVLLVCVFILAPTIGVAAQAPANCSGIRDQRAYSTGLRVGANLVRQAWRSLNDCDLVERFEDIVSSALSRYSPSDSPTNFSLCRYGGVVDGILETLDEVYFDCTDQCFLEGSFVGELSATAYCELSIALNGLASADGFVRGEVQVCGLSFEIGCDTTFMSIAPTYSNEFGECAAFTEGEYAEVFDQVVYNQCAYNPEEDSSASNSEDSNPNNDQDDEPIRR